VEKEIIGLAVALCGVGVAILQYFAAGRSGRHGRLSESPLVPLKVYKEQRTSKRLPKGSTTTELLRTCGAGLLVLLVYGGMAAFFALGLASSSEGFVLYIWYTLAVLFGILALWGLMLLEFNLLSLLTLLGVYLGFGSPQIDRGAEAVILGDDQPTIQAQCITALRKMGANILEIDSESGDIKASIGPSRFWGNSLVDNITVSITKQKVGQTLVRIESDGRRPPGFDAYRHTSNVNQFIDHLIG
jgi:hypothetical protein